MSAAQPATTTLPADTAQPAPLRPAMALTGAGTIGWVGPLLAVGVMAIGGFLGQDALMRARGSGTSWLSAGLKRTDGLAPAGWMVAAGAAAALLGVWLVVTALRPRTRDTFALTGAAGAHLRTDDVARLASAAASDVDGVLSARSSASRRSLSVKITTTGAPGTPDAVRSAVAQSLAPLVAAPRIRVRASTAGEAS